MPCAGWGTLATVVGEVSTAHGQVHALCRGQQRFRLLELVPGHDFLAARIERLEEATSASAEA